MVSKQVKLRLALTRAIVNFFSQEDLYCDELQIQGTVCITADKSAIFVTQITETITDPDHAVADDEIDGHLPLSAVVIKEPLTTSLKLKKSHTPAKPSFLKSKGGSDPNLPTAGFNHLISSPALGQVTHITSAADPHNSGAISNFQAYEPLPKYGYSDSLRNSLVVQEKLITGSKPPEVKNSEYCSSEDSENSLEGCVIVQPSRQNKHPASSSSGAQQPSSKRLKTDVSADDEKLAALNLTKKSSGIATSSSPRPTKTEAWLTNRTLLPVNPMLTPVFPGTSERQFALNPSIKQEKIDDVGTVDLRIATSPGTHGLGGDMHGTSEFPWQLASPPDGHASLSDWPANSWVRKPKTKFSPEQLRSLEDAYQSDPFLSTCAERRAELARKLNLTEKNIQIWFQNQRRRRRAAAYSRLHYSAPDSAGSSAVEADQTPGNPEKDLEEEEIVEVREGELDEEEEEEERKNDVETADEKRETQNGIDQDDAIKEAPTGQGVSEMMVSLLQDNTSQSGLPTV